MGLRVVNAAEARDLADLLKSLATLRLYLRPSNLFEANASASLGL